MIIKFVLLVRMKMIIVLFLVNPYVKLVIKPQIAHPVMKVTI